MKRIIKGIFCSPWLYLVIIPPIIFYLAVLATSGLWNGWLAFAVMLIMIAFIVWLGLRNHKLRSIRTGFLVVLALIPTVFWGSVCIPIASTTRVLAPDFTQAETQYWQLSTGSRIAYYHLSGDGSDKPLVLFLHGGPGGSVSTANVQFFSQLAALGYETYLYDQAGSGRSDFLPMSEYSQQRNVDDLAAIMEHLPQRQVIVIGHSYGSTLLADALTDERIAPRIAKAIFSEPGALTTNIFEQKEFNTKENIPVAQTTNPRKALSNLGHENDHKPRFLLLHSGFLPISNGFVSQSEVINSVPPEVLRNAPEGMVCPEEYDSYRHATPDPALQLNALVNRAIYHASNQKDFDFQAFAHNTTPAMMMLGGCSYIQREDQASFLFAYPALQRVQYFENLGHSLLRPKTDSKVLEAIVSFIEDTEAPLPNYPTTDDIREFVIEDK